MSRLDDRAAQVLRDNDRGRSTIPSPHLYPHQWAWDSGFAAIGWAHLDPDRAVLELETLMCGAWPDGRVPHIQFHDPDAAYFPGPAFWQTERSSSITQPPNWAIAARRVLELGGDPARIRALIQPMDRSHRFFFEQRDPLGWGLVAVVHPWESGLDNSPAWDAPMQAVDPARAPAFRRVDIERVEDPAERPTDEQYKRYAVLVKDIAADGFGPGGGFCVYDPLMSAILARSEADLAWLGRELGVETEAAKRSVMLQAALYARLYDPARGRCRWIDALTQAELAPDLLAAYAPLLLSEGPHHAVLRGHLRERYLTDYPLPTAAPSDPAFDPKCYWRGPSWLNMNWLLADNVGPEIVGRSLAMVEREGFREYYHPITGQGLGATDFTWSAALVLDWLRRAGRSPA